MAPMSSWTNSQCPPHRVVIDLTQDDSNEEDETEKVVLSELKGNLLATLSQIQSNGSFLTGQSLTNVANPGLHIPGLGAIRLPVSTDNAKAMIRSSRMSPYGKGSETLVNESVRKSWQLDANQFSLQNRLWQAQLDLLKEQAVTGLGLTAKPEEVKVELYKLLIYEEGAFFLPHQDSEKADGMFATLVISLPSKHEGGDVIASHKDQRLKFKTASNSAYGFSWAAWYADVMHEVKPVLSGYRVVLVYNMIHRPSAMLIKSRGDKIGRLSQLLASWSRAVGESMHILRNWKGLVADNCPPALVYLLDHQYSTAELNAARLKGVDQHRFTQLQEACRKNDCEVYLANIEKQTTGEVEDHYGHDYYSGYYGRGRRLNDKNFHVLQYVLKSSLELLHVVNTHGSVVGNNISFPESMIVQSNTFARDPDHETFGGFTGNEGAPATHFYRETGILIIPKKVSFLFEIERLKRDQGDDKLILKECERILTRQSDRTLARKGLTHVCNVLTSVKGHADSDTFEKLGDLAMKRALELADFQLFSQTLLLVDYFSSSQIALIAEVIADHGINSIRSPLDLKIKGTDKYGSRSDPNFHLLSDLMEEYHSICTQRNQTPSAEVLDWRNTTFLNKFSAELKGRSSDGQKLAEMLQGLPLFGLVTMIEKCLRLHLDNTSFIVSFMRSANALADNLDKDAVREMIRRLLPKVIQSFKIEHELDLSFRAARTMHFDDHRRITRVTPNVVIKLIKLATSMNVDTNGLMNVLLRYAGNVWGDAATGAFHELLFPVATGICEHIAQTKRPWTDGEKKFIFGLLKSYVIGYVKKARIPPGDDWKAKTTIYCTCADCDLLREFINDEQVRTQDFALAEPRRKHLEEQLDRGYFNTETDKNVKKGMGRPHILRVEKTNAMLVSSFTAWVKRAHNAKPVLKQLSEKGPLKEILGERTYLSIFNHTNLQIPGEGTLSNATNANARPTIQSTVPQKRSFNG